MTMQRRLIRIVREFIGLFVDDGSLAVVVLIWIAACGVALPKLVPTAPWQAQYYSSVLH